MWFLGRLCGLSKIFKPCETIGIVGYEEWLKKLSRRFKTISKTTDSWPGLGFCWSCSKVVVGARLGL